MRKEVALMLLLPLLLFDRHSVNDGLLSVSIFTQAKSILQW